MWIFYYSHSKQKTGRRQNELFGQSIITQLQDTLKCLWLQGLLLFLFCFDCSGASTESLILDSLSNTELLHVKPKSNFSVVNIAHAPEIKHSITPIPVWKPKVLKRGLRAQSISTSSQKLHKHNRLFKRDLENLSQKNNTSLYELASTFTEMLTKILSYKALYLWPDLENTKSVASNNRRSLSNFPEEHLKIDLLNDTTLDLLKTPSSETILHFDLLQTPPPKWDPLSETLTPAPKLDNVSQINTFSDAKTSSAVGQMESMLKLTTFAKSEDMPYIASLYEQADAPDFKLLLEQPESTVSSTQDYIHGKHNAKLLNYTDLPGSSFAITDKINVIRENSSHQSTMFNLEASSDYASDGLKQIPNSALKTIERYSAIYQPATDGFNLLDTTVSSKHETSTFSNLVPSPETSTIGLQYSEVPATGMSPTNSMLASSTVFVNTKVYSQSSKTSLSSLLFDFPDIYDLFYLRKDSWDLASVAPHTLDTVGLSSNTHNVETKTSLNTDHNTTDMTTPSMGISSVVDSTPVDTFFASSNLAVHVEQDFSTPTTRVLNDQISEHDRSLNQERGTSSTFSVSTIVPQTMSITKMSQSTIWETINMDANTLSSVTSSPSQVSDKAYVLRLNEQANTETPKLETLSLPTVYKSTEYESDATVLPTSSSVTANDVSTPVERTSTDPSSELGFWSTMTPSFQHAAFNDMNENGIINQSTVSLISTLRSTMSSTWAKKSMTTVTSLWKSRTSQQFISTVEPVQKIKTSQSTHYSTEANMSRSVSATGGQVPTSGKVLVGTRSSLDPTTITAALRSTVSPKSVADLEASSVQTSTRHSSTKSHLISKMHTHKDRMTAQHTSNSPRQPRTVTATITSQYHKPIVTGSLSSALLKTQTVSSTTRKPLTISTSTSRLASLSQSSKITSSTISTIVAPASKASISQTIFPVKPKPTVATHTNTGQEIRSAQTTTKPVVTMPLNFHLTGVSFSAQLTNRTSEDYRKLEREVKLVMDKIFFAKYQNDYLATAIKAFLKGSVIVRSNIVFQSNIYVPSESDIIRTVLTDGTKTNYFGWSINGSTVELNGYTKSNLELEVLPISLLVLRAGYIAISQKNQEKQSFMDNLQKAVFHAVHTSFPITNVNISDISDVYGDLKVRGSLYFNSTVHTNVQSVMSSLLSLVNRTVDLSSIFVNGFGNELQVYSIHFRVTNRKFALNLLDMSSSESQLLSKDLSSVVQTVLHDSNPLQVIIREFKSGSVVCRGDLVYQHPAPGSWEILRLLLKTLGSDGILGSSAYKVDFKSITIGGSRPGLFNEYVDFPGFGVAIIVMCGLCIIIFPILLFVCTKTRMLGHRQKATIQRRHDPVDQSHHFEMDNQAFRASIEQP